MTAIDDLTRLNHMRDAAQEILEFMEGQSKKSLESNRMLQMAVMKELEIIGEAANNISAECQRQYPQLPWRQMIGMRNRLVHVYFGVDVDLTFPVKCFGQAPTPHKGRIILTNHARELGFQWASYDDVRDNPPNKQQILLPKQRLK